MQINLTTSSMKKKKEIAYHKNIKDSAINLNYSGVSEQSILVEGRN
jgi:hypothetical protein